MKLFSVLIFTLFASLVQADPSWMVRIQKCLPGNGMMTGTGYIVKIGDKFLVRTAAHVTLGSETCVQMFDYKNRQIPLVPGGMISLSLLDDQMFEIQGTHSQLATYTKDIEQFILEYPLSQKVVSTPNLVQVSKEYYFNMFYIKPDRIKRHKSDELKIKSRNDEDGFMEMERTELVYSETEGSRLSRMRVLPGESGTPLMGIYFGQADMVAPSKEKNNGTSVAGPNLPSQMFGVNGQPLNLYHPQGGFRTIVAGHALGYHRVLKQSNFLPYESAKTIVNAYLAGKRGDINGVTWSYRGGTPYRRYYVNGKLIEETFFNENGKAGDGTGGNGGDGTGGNGGDGTGGNGGDGTGGNGGDGTGGNGGDGKQLLPSEKPHMGMVYDGKTIIAFRVQPKQQDELNQPFLMYANWENYRYLMLKSSLYTFEAIPTTIPLMELMEEKFHSSSRQNTGGCLVNSDSLKFGRLEMKLAGMPVIRRSVSAGSSASFKPIEVLKDNNGSALSIDYRGLFSIDLAMTPSGSRITFGKITNRKLKSNPFISYARPGQDFSQVYCSLVPQSQF